MLPVPRSLIFIGLLAGMVSTVEAQPLKGCRVVTMDSSDTHAVRENHADAVPGPDMNEVSQHRLEIEAAYHASISRFLKLIPSFRKLRNGALPVFVGEIIEPKDAARIPPRFLDIYDFDEPTLRSLALPHVEIVPQSKARAWLRQHGPMSRTLGLGLYACAGSDLPNQKRLIWRVAPLTTDDFCPSGSAEYQIRDANPASSAIPVRSSQPAVSSLDFQFDPRTSNDTLIPHVECGYSSIPMPENDRDEVYAAVILYALTHPNHNPPVRPDALSEAWYHLNLGTTVFGSRVDMYVSMDLPADVCRVLKKHGHSNSLSNGVNFDIDCADWTDANHAVISTYFKGMGDPDMSEGGSDVYRLARVNGRWKVTKRYMGMRLP